MGISDINQNWHCQEDTPLTRQQTKLINTATRILDDPHPENQELVFMARELVQITLPHSDPGDIPIWTRRNGNQILSVRPGISRGQIIGYPYGTIPRLLLFWLTTEVLKKQEKRIYLGDSLAQFMRKLHLDPGRGGKRSDYSRVRKQSERFFRSIYTNEYVDDTSAYKKTIWQDVQLAPQGEILWGYEGSENVFDGWIDLSDQAYKMFITSPVPIDNRVLEAIKNSALALDLYGWINYKTYIARTKDAPQRVPWRGLMKQLGSNYGNSEAATKTDVCNFRRKAKQVIAKIEALSPSLDIRYFDGGLEIWPANLTVRQRSKFDFS